MSSISKVYQRAVSSVIATAVLGCAADGTKTGNGIQLEFAATEQALTQVDAGASGGFVIADQQGTEFVIDQAVLVVSEVELRAKGLDLCAVEHSSLVDCTNGRLRVRQTFELDLMAPRANLALNAFEFPAVSYDRVEVRTQALDKDSDAGPVSFYVTGVVVLDGETSPFILSFKRNDTLRFEDPNGVDVPSGQWLSAQIDLRAWFAQLSLTNCIVSGDVEKVAGRFEFTEDSKCNEIERAFVEQLRAATLLSKRGL